MRQQKNTFLLCLFLGTLAIISQNCATARKYEKQANFDYQNIYNKKYIDGNGGIIKITLEKGETYSGSISPDQRYLYYTSNRDGNFDIFLRPLNDILSIPVMRSSTNQTEPVISPDGKNLVFVDDELDPEGDLAVVKLNPDSVIRNFSRNGQDAVDAMFIDDKRFLTNNLKNISRSRESNPAWSPDGNWIAYASNRTSSGSNRFGPGFGAPENIWILSFDKPENARQLTANGGIMPCFSPDGKKILYVNEDESRFNHIYELEIASRKIRQITFADSLDINPGYTTNGKNIVFTRIYQDTNNDDMIDYKDSGQIFLMPVPGDEIPTNPEITEKSIVALTTKKENIFNTKVIPFLGGTILFAMKEGDNINLALIPETGILLAKKTSLEQLEFAKSLTTKSVDESLLAFTQLDYAYNSDPMRFFASTLKDYELLIQNKQLKLNKKSILDKWITSSAESGLFKKIMLDIYLKNHPEDIPENYEFLIASSSLEDYLKNIYEKPQLAIEMQETSGTEKTSDEEYDELNYNALSVNEKSILGYLHEEYARLLFQSGKMEQARKVYQFILFHLPDYYNNAEILYTLGKNNLITGIPIEYIHLLSPTKHPYLVRQSPKSGDTNGEFITENNFTVKQIQINAGETIKNRVQNDLFNFFEEKYSQNQEALVNDLMANFIKDKDLLIYSLSRFAFASYLSSEGKFIESSDILSSIDIKTFNNSSWLYKYYLLYAKNREKENQTEIAFEMYTKALLQYENKYQYGEVNDLIINVFSYYRKLAETRRKNGEIEKAWQAYSSLLNLILYLESRQISKNIVEPVSLPIFTSLDEMLLNNFESGNPVVKSVMDFYYANVAFARKNTINSFIFGRAYLNAMLGIKQHLFYESTNDLNNLTKEHALSYFYEAEEDFQWSMYVDSSFADSYMMLGWMYQFIDEKRDAMVISKIGTETDIDKKIFKSIYDKYFPDYLFEKNIQLYQKSIAFISGKSSYQMLQSLYLNLANNYYLLNNFTKAEEYYSKISTNGINKYSFESREQEAQYYYHIGKTNYFLGRPHESSQFLEKAMEFYPQDTGKLKSSTFQQRRLIFQYMALANSDAGKFERASDNMKQILFEAGNINLKENFSMIYLEIARNILAHIKSSHNLTRIPEALEYTRLAETQLKHFPEILPPKFSLKFKIFGLTLPFGFSAGSHDNNYIKGENHIAYPLPTINQYQYLYSLQSDLYKLNGNLPKAAEANKKLFDSTDKDDTKHGNETRITSLMRLGELFYIDKNIGQSRKTYEEARKLALDQQKMHLYYVIQKNLMTLACKEIDISPSHKKKLDLAKNYLKELYDFKENYLKLKVSQAQKEISDKNKNLKLSIAEQNQVEISAIKDISEILLYEGIFKSFISSTEDLANHVSKSGDFNNYFELKFQHFQKHKSALNALDGKINIHNSDLSLVDTKKKRRMGMILDMNKGFILENMGNFQEALDIYSKISNRAFEVKAHDLFIVSGYRQFQVSKLLKQDSLRILKNLDTIFKLNPYLAKKHPDIFRDVNDMMITENINNYQLYNTLYMENYNRMMEIQETIDLVLRNSNEDLKNNLSQFSELETMEEILSLDIEHLKLKRENTKSLESIMAQLLKRKVAIKQLMLNHQQFARFALCRFPDLLTVNDIMNIGRSFLYLIHRNGILYAIYKLPYENKFDLKIFKFESNDLSFFAQNENNPDKNNTSEFNPEVIRFIQWARSKQIEIVYPDRIFSRIPFSRVLKYNVAQDYTFQATILYQNNTTVSSTNWIQNTNHKVKPMNPDQASHLSYNIINRNDDVTKLQGKYNAIDFEISENFFSDNSNALNNLLNNRENTSLTLLSYNFKNNSNLDLYLNSLSLLFSAANSSIVIHAIQDRKSSTDVFNKLFINKNNNANNIVYTGNPEISRIFFNLENRNYLNRYLQLETQDLQRCLLQSNEYIRNDFSQEAVLKLDICENIDFDIKVRQIAQTAPEKEDAYKFIIVDSAFFLKKSELMLQNKAVFKYSTIEKNFEKILKSYQQGLTNNENEKEYFEFLIKYISLLLVYKENSNAYQIIKSNLKDYEINHKEIFKLSESYYIGELNHGNLENLQKELPPEILALDPNRDYLQDIPEEYISRINFFIQQSGNLDYWFNALSNSGEYVHLNDWFANTKVQNTSWNALSSFLVTGKKPAGIIESNDVNLVIQYITNPRNADLALKITNESRDPYIKLMANLIQMTTENKYDNTLPIVEKISSLKTSDHANSREIQSIKQTFILFLLNSMNYHLSPEDYLNNIIKIISSTKFDSGLFNRQQITFKKLTNSISLYVNSPSELNKFPGNSSEQLSDMNIAFVRKIKNLALQVNPLESINSFQAKTNEIYNSAEFDSAQKKIMFRIQDGSFSENDYNEFSLVMLYYIKSREFQKALFNYFYFDQNQVPESNGYVKPVNGFLKIFSDQYYHWNWNKNKIEFTKIKINDFEKIMKNNSDNIFYLPGKDGIIRSKLLTSGLKLRYFTSSPVIANEFKIPLPGELTWSYGPETKNLPGYSLLKINLPPAEETEHLTTFGFFTTMNLNINKHAGLNFYSKHVTMDLLNSIQNNKDGKYFHIVYTKPDILNIYLSFMKEFLIQSRENPGQIMTMFDNVYKVMEKKYSNSDDLKYLMILQN